MADNPPVYIILTTYQREEYATKTVQALKDNLQYDNVGWFLVDDGSKDSYIERLRDLIGSNYHVYSYNSNRRGVGHGMNTALRDLWSKDIDYILMMEDDWVLKQPLDLLPYIKTLQNNESYGMIRFGYLSTGLLGYTVGAEGKLYWRLDPNGETYRFTGHPSLRHRRFHDKFIGGVGLYDEGLTPGMTELSMCGKANKYGPPPHILYPCEAGMWGFFDHIGSQHMGDITPEIV